MRRRQGNICVDRSWLFRVDENVPVLLDGFPGVSRSPLTMAMTAGVTSRVTPVPLVGSYVARQGWTLAGLGSGLQLSE